MPKLPSIKKVLVIGSGPIVIGQAAEFDYAGTQALTVLKQEGVEIVLINSNPATIMTDASMADHVYLEPLTLETVKRICLKEKPDSILSGLGGQTGLTLCMQLAKEGFLKKHKIQLLGSSPDTIDKAEDRQLFKSTMESIGQPVIPSVIATDLPTALSFAHTNGYPVIIRPAFTLAGTGGGIAESEEEFKEIAQNGLALSPIHQILVERCIAGWKEIEFEVMRDKAGTVLSVCSMENFDPVGIHTGDSIVVAPALTLADKEFQMLRSAALQIIETLGVEGGCNCQFALHPHSFEYAVIEVNPRVSRSSSLASKATGYPIAKVATKIALGYTLDEIRNDVTGKTFAAFEPALDYVAVKFPKWPFDKFVYAKKELGTQMKATGEVMAISDTFESALMKAVRGAEIGVTSLHLPRLKSLTDEELRDLLSHHATDDRLFLLYEAIWRGFYVDELHVLTQVDRFFLYKLKNLADYEKQGKEADYNTGKRLGYSDADLRILLGDTFQESTPSYLMVDTCAGEFAATTPYFYSVYGAEDEGELFLAGREKPRIMVLGSGPIRIGQGIEFDYACVHCVRSLRSLGYEVIVVNNNPETVSTDFDTAHRLYFEPLCLEDVMHIVHLENPLGVVVAFGGGTAIKLAKGLAANGVKILGSSAETIDICEDRERFDALLESLKIARPKGFSAKTQEEALTAAHSVGFPVLMRPSYVIGGQNMIIAYDDDDIKEYMGIISSHGLNDNPVLIDEYIAGLECEVDAICDGTDILIPGIMEHVERTGIHSGDSIAIYPSPHISKEMQERILQETRKICQAVQSIGLVNIQYIVKGKNLYVIEVNPRASRTIPYLSKITGVPMCHLATAASLGMTLESLGYPYGIYPIPSYYSVKVPVFSFEKLEGVDTQLGPEMKSTGEVLGIGLTLEEALYKGLLAAGYRIKKTGGVFITVQPAHQKEVGAIAKKFAKLGYSLYATQGTADTIEAAGLKVERVNKIHENPQNNSMTLLDEGNISIILSTSRHGRNPAKDSVKIRRKACMHGIPCLTSLDTANALADSLLSSYEEDNTSLIDMNQLPMEKENFAHV